MQKLFQNNKQLFGLFFLISLILYGNTLLNQFALDDAIVLKDNEYVQKGIGGIADILNKDTFRGFFKKEGKDLLVVGGRYRPMTLVFFAIAHEFFGNTAFMYHLMNILFYAALGFIFFLCFQKLLELKFKENSQKIAFIGAILFMVHPIHTECVANIKGLDEIFVLMFSLIAFYFAMLYVEKKQALYILLTGLSFTVAMFSKENAICYVLIIPLGIYLFLNKNIKELIPIGFVLSAVSVFFIIIRSTILGINSFKSVSMELMNNPYLKWAGDHLIPYTSSEKLGTINFTLLKYLGLLVWPHPLTHDYYPMQIPVTSISDPKSILAMICYVSIILVGIICIRKNSIISFCILLFLLPLFIVSNLLFAVGTHMGERFIFMPSVGFALLVAYFLVEKLKMNKAVMVLIAVAVTFMSFKTFTRNFAWKNDYTLFSTDVKNSPNSAKVNNALGGVTLEKLQNEKDSLVIRRVSDEAIKYLNKATLLYPGYKDAYVLLGNAYFYQKNYPEAIRNYQKVLTISPNSDDAKTNLHLSFREYGRERGMKFGDVTQALQLLQEAYKLNSKDVETLSLLGIASGVSKNYTAAIEYFSKVIEVDEKNAQAYFNLFITYQNLQNPVKANEMLEKAKSLDKDILTKNGIQASK